MSDLGGVQKIENKKDGEARFKFIAYRNYPVDTPHWDKFNASIFQFFFGINGIAVARWPAAFNESSAPQSRTFTQLAEHCGKLKELDEFLTGFVRQIKEELDALVVSTRIVDTSDEFMEI